MLKPAATGNPWGFASIWSSGANGTNIPTNPRENSLSRDHVPQVKSTQPEEIVGKTGSGSLVDSSVSEEYVNRSWATRVPASGRPLPTGRHTDNVLMQQRSASSAGLQIMPGANASLMPLGTRPPTINLNQTAGAQSRQRYNSTFEYTSDFAAQPGEQPPFKVYTKHDRPIDPAQRKQDSANGYSSTTPSPSDERRPPFSSQYGRTASMPTSQDGSLPPSRDTDDPPTWTPVDYSSRSSQRVTPNTSRAPSISSRGNGACNPYFNVNTDTLTSNVRQLNINSDSRPGTAYKQAHSIQNLQGYQGPNQTGMARSGFHRQDDTNDVERANMQYLGLEDYAPVQPANNASSSFAERYLHAGGLNEFRPGQPYVGSVASSRSHDFTNGSRTPSEWQNHSGGGKLVNRRSPAVPEQYSYLDPRIQHYMAAQLQVRNAYAGMYSPYALQQLGQQYVQLMPLNTTGLDMPATPRDSPITDCLQSALMYEFKSNTKTKRYELRDIYEHIAEFSGDQHGSRFIQTKLETANSDEKEHVFREIEPNAIPLMTDVFGNYVIQKFFEHGDQTHKKILANKMRGHVLTLTVQMYGCRVVQKALDHVLVDQQRDLITELEHHVVRCVKDQNGNHVVQKAIERCQASTIEFIIAAFQGQVQQLSIHPYGCRVIQRCLEKSDLPRRGMVMSELMQGIGTMISDQFGNYVVQHIVAHDEGEGRQQVLDIVASGLEGYSKHKFASNVVEKCLERADDLWRQNVMYSLVESNARRTEGEGVLVGMIKDNFGNYVIRRCPSPCYPSIANNITEKLLDTLMPNDYNHFLGSLHPAMAQAKRSGCGKQTLSIEKKMHRFDSYRNGGSISHHHGLQFHVRPGHDFQQPIQMPMQIPMAMQPFETGYHSAAITPPPLTADTHSSISQSLQSSCLPSVNGDAVEGAAASRKGSDPSSLYSIDDVQKR